jgi:hypothetical protein
LTTTSKATSPSTTTSSNFRLIVDGNIFIRPGVTQIDGTYAASGSLYTCAITSSTTNPYPTTGADYYNQCHANPLTVNGALYATTLKLTRIAGTLRDALPTDGLRIPNTSIVNGLYGSDPSKTENNGISEYINFTPEVYLANPVGVPVINKASKIDATTALPPLF